MCLLSTGDRQESLKKSCSDRDTLLAVVSHELRTPTAAILGWAMLLSEGRADEETLAHGIKAIERNARFQKLLIEQLLDFSRAENGFLRLDARKSSLAPVLAAAVDTMKPLAEAKNIDLRLSLDAATCAVIGDPIRLQQVVTNLLANAVKFTPAGGLIDVRLARRGAWAEVTVSDTGRGIRPEFLPYIFDAFRKGENDQATAHDGLGLGLAISRQIVEGHGGKISAESPGEGKGATFTVSLPVEDEAAAINLQA